MLVLTKGKDGATYYFSQKNQVVELSLNPDIISKAIDTSGAGDAFFSRTLRDYAYLKGPITEDFIINSFKNANANARAALSHIGSRDTQKKPCSTQDKPKSIHANKESR